VQLERFPDGVWLVEHHSVGDSGALEDAITAALSLREERGLSRRQSVDRRECSKHARNGGIAPVLKARLNLPYHQYLTDVDRGP
jgi:hypothetical protein